jgi:uncharacterized membrane protein (UPF0127 family)
MGSSNRDSGWRQLIGGVACLIAMPLAAAAESACQNASVTLRGDWGSARFNIEIADDREEQALGLMNREHLPASAGMLFVYPAPQKAQYWMRNTLIPLDMLFVDAQGVVQHIHHDAVPLDETLIYGGDKILAVLEINGGMADRMGISEGTELHHRVFAAHDPAWPCN